MAGLLATGAPGPSPDALVDTLLILLLLNEFQAIIYYSDPKRKPNKPLAKPATIKPIAGKIIKAPIPVNNININMNTLAARVRVNFV
jgi:hypothetical protein